MNYVISLLTAVIMLTAITAHAHTLWVNTVESYFHKPAHVLSTIGWGHMPPMDDLPDVALKSYSLYDPDLAKSDLPMPSKERSAPLDIKDGPTVISGDIGANKLILKEGSKEGTYQISLEGKGNYYTHYINKKGRKKWALKPKDEISDAKEIIRGMLYKGSAVAYFKVNKWTPPKSVGHDLEIFPVTDLSDVKVGDLVKFKILFKGRELSTSPETSIEYITAVSDSFGGPDKYALTSMIFGGKGQFRMPAAGKWLVNVYTRQEVTAENELKELAGKCDVVLFSSSITFTVKP